MSKKQLATMITAEALTYASLGCASGLFIGLIFSKWLYDFLVTSHFTYAVSVGVGVRKPIKQLEGMSITETINQL